MPFYQFDAVDKIVLFPGWHAKVIHGAHMTFILWQTEPGAILPAHSHPHEQIAHLIEGEFELTIDGETRRIAGGSLAVIPPHAVHSGVALTACTFTDSFSPVREDYRQRQQAAQ